MQCLIIVFSQSLNMKDSITSIFFGAKNQLVHLSNFCAQLQHEHIPWSYVFPFVLYSN